MSGKVGYKVLAYELYAEPIFKIGEKVRCINSNSGANKDLKWDDPMYAGEGYVSDREFIVGSIVKVRKEDRDNPKISHKLFIVFPVHDEMNDSNLGVYENFLIPAHKYKRRRLSVNY